MGVYIIKPGDTWYGISKRFGIEPSTLFRLNPQVDYPNIILPGQSINIPNTTPTQPPQPPDDSQGADPPWLVIAFGELGQSEIPGQKDNQRIAEYHAATTLGRVSEKWAWCSISGDGNTVEVEFPD